MWRAWRAACHSISRISAGSTQPGLSHSSSSSSSARRPRSWCRNAPTPQQQRRWTGTWVDSQGYEHFGAPPPSWRRQRVALLVAGTAGAGGFAYYWSCRQEVPYTHRHHAIMLVSERMELLIGQQTFQEVTQQAAASHSLLPPNHPAMHLVKRVGLRIAQVAADGGGGGYWQHMRNLDWEFAVVNSDDVNAFVVPGGKVVVYTGLLRLMRTEDELAAVLAHEVGHVLARHHAERMSQLNVTGLANLLLRALLGVSIPGVLVMVGMFLPYSRAAENEADAIGIHLLARACYDPDANITMLQKLAAAQAQAGVSQPELLSTHPLTQERVQRVRALLPAAYGLRQQSCSHLQDVFGAMAEAFDEVFPESMVLRGLRLPAGGAGGGDDV